MAHVKPSVILSVIQCNSRGVTGVYSANAPYESTAQADAQRHSHCRGRKFETCTSHQEFALKSIAYIKAANHRQAAFFVGVISGCDLLFLNQRR